MEKVIIEYAPSLNNVYIINEKVRNSNLLIMDMDQAPDIVYLWMWNRHDGVSLKLNHFPKAAAAPGYIIIKVFQLNIDKCRDQGRRLATRCRAQQPCKWISHDCQEGAGAHKSVVTFGVLDLRTLLLKIIWLHSNFPSRYFSFSHAQSRLK